MDDADLARPRDLLHLLNAMAEMGRPVLIASRLPPARWEAGLADLDSRVRAITAVEIAAADEELLAKLLARLLRERQLDVKPEAQAWLRLRLPRSQAAMHAAAAAVERVSHQAGTRLTLALLREVVAAVEGREAALREDFAAGVPRSVSLL